MKLLASLYVVRSTSLEDLSLDVSFRPYSMKVGLGAINAF